MSSQIKEKLQDNPKISIYYENCRSLFGTTKTECEACQKCVLK